MVEIAEPFRRAQEIAVANVTNTSRPRAIRDPLKTSLLACSAIMPIGWREFLT